MSHLGRESHQGKATNTATARGAGASPLLTSIVVLLLATAGTVLAYKKVDGVRGWFEAHFRVEKDKSEKPQADAGRKPEGDGRSQESLLQRLDRIEEEARKTSRKVKILGIAHNENFSAVSEQSGVKDLIMLGHDWKMSSAPKMLEIAEEDKKFVEENVSR